MFERCAYIADEIGSKIDTAEVCSGFVGVVGPVIKGPEIQYEATKKDRAESVQHMFKIGS